MNKEELIVELENNFVEVNIDDIRISYCNSLDKELIKAIYNLQQENKKLKEKLNLVENILYDYLYKDGKITKELYSKVKGE